MTAEDVRESTRKPFYERGSFKAVVAVVGLVGGLWAFLGPPAPFDLASELTSDEPLPFRNTEIILDASAVTGERFGDSTKLAVAAAAVGRYAAASEETGLALRRVGGSCGDAGDPLVGFDDGQGVEIAEAALSQEPAGESNLTQAVRAAIADFSGGDFHRSESENTIIVFVGSSDSCEGEAGELIRDELESAEIKASFQLFAIDVSGKALKNLKAMERQLEEVAAVQLREADSVEDLYEEVEDANPEIDLQALTIGEETETTETTEAEATETSETETTETTEPTETETTERTETTEPAETEATETEPTEEETFPDQLP